MEDYPTFELEMSSRSSELDQEQPDEIEAKVKRKIPREQTTELGLKKFTSGPRNVKSLST